MTYINLKIGRYEIQSVGCKKCLEGSLNICRQFMLTFNPADRKAIPNLTQMM